MIFFYCEPHYSQPINNSAYVKPGEFQGVFVYLSLVYNLLKISQ